MIKYETKDSYPTISSSTIPSATIYMGGLLCLCFDGDKKCTVGVNQADRHEWKLRVRRRGASKPILALNAENFEGEVHIKVTGGTTGSTSTSKLPGTYVYKGSDVSIASIRENRFNLERNWVDLEGDRGHTKKVDNDDNTLWPRIYIDDGLFSAYKLSTGKFELKNGNSITKTLNKVALAVAADIFLDTSNPNRKIEIELPDATLTLDHTKHYQIFITNDCTDCTEDEIDFDHHYKSFSKAFPNVKDRFKLDYEAGSLKGEPGPIFPLDEGFYSPLSDRAPCMTATLGQTTSFK